MNTNRFTINLNSLLAYTYITWGMWYVFFNASLTLRPYYSVLWPALVVVGVFFRLPQIIASTQKNKDLFYLYSLFALTCVLSLLFSKDISASIDYIVRFVLSFGFVLVALSFKRNDIILKVMRVFSLAMLAFSLAQYIIPSFYKSSILPLVSQPNSPLVLSALRSNEALGLTNGTSQNGLFMAIGFVLYSTRWFCTPKNKLFNAIIALTFWGMTFVTAKRSYSLCVIVIWALLLFYSVPEQKKQLRWFRLLVVILIVFAALLFATNYIPVINNVIEKTLDLHQSGDITNGRFELYISAWKMFLESAFIGVGIDATSSMMGGAVHNSYLQWLMEFGLIFVIIPAVAICIVPIIKRKRIVSLISSYMGKQCGYEMLTYYLLMLLILGAGFFAMPFQWTNIFMLYMMCQFMCQDEIVNNSISA